MPVTPLAMPVIRREPKNSSGEFSPFSITTTPHSRSGTRTTFACEPKPLPSWEICRDAVELAHVPAHRIGDAVQTGGDACPLQLRGAGR